MTWWRLRSGLSPARRPVSRRLRGAARQGRSRPAAGPGGVSGFEGRPGVPWGVERGPGRAVVHTGPVPARRAAYRRRGSRCPCAHRLHVAAVTVQAASTAGSTRRCRRGLAGAFGGSGRQLVEPAMSVAPTMRTWTLGAGKSSYRRAVPESSPRTPLPFTGDAHSGGEAMPATPAPVTASAEPFLTIGASVLDAHDDHTGAASPRSMALTRSSTAPTRRSTVSKRVLIPRSMVII